jgi:hypothetical protein
MAIFILPTTIGGDTGTAIGGDTGAAVGALTAPTKLKKTAASKVLSVPVSVPSATATLSW